MKTKKLLSFLTIVFYLGMSNCYSQQSPTSSGGDLIGSNGSVAYSVGQIVYTTNTGSNGSVSQGVQQPYEISEVLASEDFSELINDLIVYPNPSTDVLTINMSNSNGLELDYAIIDVTGKVLKSKKNIENETSIVVSDLPSAIYFLQITNKNKEVKTFKIIKK
ncbi:T9SS type A sorting domain-containing protein [Flavobacterium sp. N2270]|uniref:T9SS type A sorting domain-containing protein n=1 Tax=Flavobacterium sp. N2270 TaxID=2986831 RepID=UPI00222511E1|nr:T9SS type A sorting domain-containing protein [Flavobacterium sp. N2270]